MIMRSPNRASGGWRPTSDLSRFLACDPDDGLRFACEAEQQRVLHPKVPPVLKHYYADAETDAVIEHNVRWANGGEDRPQFRFAYLMLPTACNQSCTGCFMGQDKNMRPSHLSGPHFSEPEASEIFEFLVGHGAKSVVYGGGGELFTWKGAFDLIENAHRHGLTMVIFTNGSVLTEADISSLNDLGAVLIFSLRDTTERLHNEMVGGDFFLKTMRAIDSALVQRFHLDNRLCVEIPVTRANEGRVINEFLPAMRHLGIVPMIEEFIQLSTSPSERQHCHTFAESRVFFARLAAEDARLGYQWQPTLGQRIASQPKCKRPLYSFAVFPSRDVLDCPSHSICYGNLKRQPLGEVLYSDQFRRAIRQFSTCACSVFYTRDITEIPAHLPPSLEVLV